jgi:hypothetical protein
MTVDWLSTTDPLWKDRLYHIPHDVYHLPQYLEVCAKYEGTDNVSAASFYAEDHGNFCLIPVLRRPLPTSLGAPPAWSDLRSPYGYPAPLFRGDSPWIETALNAFVAECRSQDIISAFLRMHPLLCTWPVTPHHGQLVKHGETVYVDLALTELQLWSQTRGRLRSYINSLRREGFACRFDDWSTYEAFSSIYRNTMERLHADTFYRFPAEYFRDLRTGLGDCLHLCSVMSPEGNLACGALLTATESIVQYHLSGTADEFLDTAPSKLMLHEIALWAKRTGHKVLHLGGGVGGRADSLLHFKSGFSSLRSDFMTYRLICDEDKYAFLCGQLHNGGSDETDYFPRYRSGSDD